jgi:hypothetical protein
VATRREGGGGRRTREAKRCRGTGASGVATWEGGGRGDAGREGGCGAIMGLEGREVAAHVGDLFTGGCRVPISVGSFSVGLQCWLYKDLEPYSNFACDIKLFLRTNSYIINY